MKNLRVLLVLVIFINMLFATGVPLKITKFYTKSSKNDVSICVNFDRYFNNVSSDKLKPFIKIVPNHQFFVSSYYDSLCIKNLEPNKIYKVTIDKKIPLNIGLDKTYQTTIKTPNYEPSFKFKESGYILPTIGDISIPLEIMNTPKLVVKLYRVNRNNLIQMINSYKLAENLSSYDLEDIKRVNGYFLWKKYITINYTPNTPKTIAIDVGKYIKKREPGVYILAVTNLENGEENSWDTKTQWFMLSDIGIYTQEDSKGLHIFTKHLSTAAPYENVKIELISKNNEVLTKTIAKKGYAFIKKRFLQGKDALKPGAIYAYGANGDFSVLDFSRSPLDLTDRGVDGRVANSYYDGIIFTNRGIFKPGESVPFDMLIRDNLANALSGISVTLKFFDSRDKLIDKRLYTTDKLGHINGVFKIPKNAHLGRFKITASIKSDENIAKLDILVQDFVPPKIELVLKDKPSILLPNKKEHIKFKAKFLTGDEFPNPQGNYKIILAKAKNPFKEYKKYHFGDIDDSFDNYYVKEKDFKGDSNGTIDIPIKLSSSYQTTLPINAYINASVLEPGGRVVSKWISVFYNLNYGYIGIKPMFEDDTISLFDNPKFNVVFIKDGNASKAKLHYKLIEQEVEWNWENSNGSWEYYASYIDKKEILKGDLQLQNYPLTLKLDKLDWGYYKLYIYDDKGDISSYRFSVGYSLATTKASPDKLPIAVDKKIYKVNDKIKVQITPKFSGPVIVSIANSKILATKEIVAKEGVKSVVEFKVKDNWGASAYVLATAFRAQSKKLGANRAIGVAHFLVDKVDKIIDLHIDAPNKIESNSILNIKVTSKKAIKDETNLAIFVVDRGILNLTNYKEPNLSKYYLGKKALSITIRDIYAELIKATGEHAEFDVGSGEEDNLNKSATVNKRVVLAKYKSPIKFKNGVAKVSFKIPSFQGSAKIIAVAWSKKGIGSSSKKLIIKNKISIESYMPKFLALNDRADILIDIKFDKNVIKPGIYKIKVKGSGGVSLNKEFNFEYDGKNEFIKKVKVKATKLEDGKIAVEVYKDSKMIQKRDFKLAIRTASIENFARKVGILDKNKKLIAKNLVKEPWDVIKNVQLTLQSTPLIAIDSIKDELMAYCCRCAEQTTSRAFPYINDKNQSALVQSAIDRLKVMQHIDGSFSLWSSLDSDMWVSAYVMDFLTRAKKAGFNVPDKNIKEGLLWLQNNLYRYSDNPRKQEADAYALYVLARNSKVIISDINYHINNPNSKIKSALSWGHLAAALKLVGEDAKAKEVFERAKKALGNGGYFNYGGALRDKAALIVLLKESGFNAMATSLFVDLALDLKYNQYLSTQEMSQIIRAYNAIDIIKTKMDILINNKPFKKHKIVIKAKSLDKLPQIKNLGHSIWYNLSFVGVSSKKIIADNGFSIKKELFSLDGKRLNSNTIAKNSRVVVVISGKIEDRAIKNPIILDLLPAGFEIENPNFAPVNEIYNLPWLKNVSSIIEAEHRDDRFITTFTPNSDRSFKVAYIADAVTKGEFSYPLSLIEDMYQPRYRALSNNSNKLIIKKLSQKIKHSESNQTKAKLTSSDFTRAMQYPITNLDSYDTLSLYRLRNGIFAQIGLDFSKTNPALDNYFKQFSWYKPTIQSGSEAYNRLPQVAKDNVLKLLQKEKERLGGSLVLADFYKIKSRLVTKDELRKYSKRDLRILRNSLIANYGYIFKDKELNQIFRNLPFYKPNPKAKTNVIIDELMNQTQRVNLDTILEVEKEMQ